MITSTLSIDSTGSRVYTICFITGQVNKDCSIIPANYYYFIYMLPVHMYRVTVYNYFELPFNYSGNYVQGSSTFILPYHCYMHLH